MMSDRQALEILYDMANQVATTKDEAEIEGPAMWRTYIEQQEALGAISLMMERIDNGQAP